MPPGICLGSHQGHFGQLGPKRPEHGCADCPALVSQQSCVHAPVVVLPFHLSLGHQQEQVLLCGLVYDRVKGLLQHLPHQLNASQSLLYNLA